MATDLHKPLGVIEHRRRERRPRRAWKAPLAVALVAAAVVGGSLLTALRQPEFLRVADLPSAPAMPTADPQPVGPVETVAPAPTIIRGDATAGVRTAEVSPFALDDAYTGSIRVFEPGSLRQPERLAHLPDQALLESSAFGLLPRRATDGRRPLDVYAGETSGTRGTRIALVVGGLGISQNGTQIALRTLPRSVTLGFAASGNSLDRWMQDARRSGHELVLQAPMEPFGYPNITPGPNTLTVEDASAGNFDALHRAMARMTNYVGVMNFMGARLTSEPAALEAMLGEFERRGLLYLDDGSSARSAARDVAIANRVPFAQGERILDTVRDAAAIRSQLDILERSARAQGSAIGIASAFDVSVQTIADWVREAEGRGIEIVPVSALAFDPQAN